jgi:hypothetical protein
LSRAYTAQAGQRWRKLWLLLRPLLQAAQTLLLRLQRVVVVLLLLLHVVCRRSVRLVCKGLRGRRRQVHRRSPRRRPIFGVSTLFLLISSLFCGHGVGFYCHGCPAVLARRRVTRRRRRRLSRRGGLRRRQARLL